jgi:hypothetical protein
MSFETIDAVSIPEVRPDTWNIEASDDPDDEEVDELTVPTMASP